MTIKAHWRHKETRLLVKECYGGKSGGEVCRRLTMWMDKTNRLIKDARLNMLPRSKTEGVRDSLQLTVNVEMALDGEGDTKSKSLVN